MIPIDILTADNQRIVEEVAKNRHTHRDHAVAAMFSATATMLGKRAQSSIDSYTNYSQLWLAIVGYTSEAKSPAVRFFYEPIFRREARLAAEYKQKLRSAYSSGLSIFHANSAVAKVTSVQLNPYTTGVQVTSVT